MSDHSIPCWVVKLVARLGRAGRQETAPKLQITMHTQFKIEFRLLIAASYSVYVVIVLGMGSERMA